MRRLRGRVWRLAVGGPVCKRYRSYSGNGNYSYLNMRIA